MDRNLNELQLEFEALEAQGAKMRPLRRSKAGKLDYILSIQDYYTDLYRRQGTMSPGMEWVAQWIESPMLANRENYLSEEDLQKMMESSEVVADEKLDGVRILAYYSPEYGFEFFSRNRSVTDYHLARYTDQINGLSREQTRGLFKKSFCLDCELISTNPSINGRIQTDTVLNAVTSLLALNQAESWEAQASANFPLRLKPFDLIMFDGQNMMFHTLKNRLKALSALLPAIRSKFSDVRKEWFPDVVRCYGDKKAFYQELTAANGEGIILKRLDSTYRAVEARGKDDWVKVKRTVSESMGADIDAFVTGFTLGEPGSGWEGLVGSLDVSVYLLPSGNVHNIARVSNIDLETRKRITVLGTDGQPTLDPSWMGKVLTIEGQDISSRARRFTHARITLVREDGKLPHQCQFDEAFLNSLVL